MFKKHSKNIKKLWLLSTYIFFLCIIFFSSTSFSAINDVSILWDYYDSIKWNIFDKNLMWKTVVTDIFDKTLKTIEDKQFKVLYETTKYVYDKSISQCWTISLDNFFSMNYILNKEYKNNLDKTMFDINKNWIKLDTDWFDVFLWCKKYLKCKWYLQNVIDISSHRLTKDEYNLCKVKVTENYIEISSNFDLMENLDNENILWNRYQNWTLDDSDYDLLIDIQKIWEILFREIKEPAETLFYQLPSLENVKNNFWLNDNIQNNYDQNNTWNDIINNWNNKQYICPKWIESSSNTYLKNWIKIIIPSWWLSSIVSFNNNQNKDNVKNNDHNIIEDDDFNKLVWNNQKNSSSKIWNSCEQKSYCWNWLLDIWEECDDGNNINDDLCSNDCKQAKHWDGIIQKIIWEECDDNNNINNDFCSNKWKQANCWDGIIQKNLWEECDDGNIKNNDWCNIFCKFENNDENNNENNNWNNNENGNENDWLTWYCWDWIIQKNLWEECDDGNNINNDCCSSQCKNEKYISQEKIINIENEKKLEEFNILFSKEILSWNCKQKCSQLPIDEKLYCLSQCACFIYSWVNIWRVFSEPAVKIKFCTIPAESINLIKKKKITSIEEIITAFYSIVKDLVDWWNTLIHTQTKDFLDSSLKENKISDMLSINFIVSFWSYQNVKYQNSNLWIWTPIEIFKNFVDEKISWIGTPVSKTDRNKYIISDKNYMNQNLLSDDFLDKMIIKKQQTILNEIISFLENNYSFWSKWLEMFEKLNDTAITLANK